jgi:hypothetical protein
MAEATQTAGEQWLRFGSALQVVGYHIHHNSRIFGLRFKDRCFLAIGSVPAWADETAGELCAQISR